MQRLAWVIYHKILMFEWKYPELELVLFETVEVSTKLLFDNSF